MPIASIIIPTHNRAATLPASVHSALAQSVGDIEVLIAGDGCTPATRATAAALATADPRVRFLDRPKAPFRGAANRDAAVREARAPLIFYNDDDDLLLPHHVATLAPWLGTVDVIDTPVVSVRPDGGVDLGLHDSGEAVQRRLLGEGRLKTVFDTHLAHTRSAYLACGAAWSDAAGDDKPVGNVLQLPARNGALRWASVARITALSFHGARRAAMDDAARAAELARWEPRIADDGIEPQLRAVGTYNFHASNLTWAMARASVAADWQAGFVSRLLDAAGAGEAAHGQARATLALSLRDRGELAATAAVFCDLIAARYGPIFPVRHAVSKLRPAFTFAEIADMLPGADPAGAALVRLLIAVRTNRDWQAANIAARQSCEGVPDWDRFGFAAEAMAIVGERQPDAARLWADLAEECAPDDYAEPFRADQRRIWPD